MRKIQALLFLAMFLLPCTTANALNIGTYKADTQYGLIDGFKFNVFDRRENKKIVELKSETEEGKAEIEREKNTPVEQDEYQLFRFIQENTVPF